MRVVYDGSETETTKLDGQILREMRAPKQSEQNQRERPDKSVRPVTRINGNRIRFTDLAHFAWPHKTEFHLAHLVHVDPRTARRWLAGDNEPPAEALGVILAEIMKRFHQRD